MITVAILVAGSWSVWAVVGTTAPTGKPAAPLWFSPPAPETSAEDLWAPPTVVSTEDSPATHAPASQTRQEDETHRRKTGSAPATSTASTAPTTMPTRPAESGDDHGGSGHRGRG